MIRRFRLKLLLSSVLILVPAAAAGLQLAGIVAADRVTSPKLVGIVWMSAAMLVIHWLALFACLHDPKNRSQHPAVLEMIFWICPLISACSCAAMYQAYTRDSLNSRPFLIFPALGLIFVVLGNYLPKISPNHTIGIRVPWALQDEENWYATHRMAGRIWMICGFVVLIACLFSEPQGSRIIAPAILAAAILPILYSYWFYRRKKKSGEPLRNSGLNQTLTSKQRLAVKISVAFTILITGLCVVLLFTGDLHMRYDEESFTVHSAYWPDLTVRYDEIESVDYRTTDSPGTRTYGYGSMRLLMGDFANREFGAYLRYSYTGNGPCVVLKVNGQTIVVGGKDEESTRAIYEELAGRAGTGKYN